MIYIKNNRNTNNNNNSKLYRSDKGITLIALVITIIILLILVSISLLTISDDEGLLNRSRKANEITKKEEEKEILQVILIEYEGTDKTGLYEYLQKRKENEEIVKEVKNGEANVLTVTVDKYEFVVDEDKLEILERNEDVT